MGIAILSAIAVAAQGDVVLYDNSETQIGDVLNFPNAQEIGDQIYLANYAADPYLTGFSFEYYSPNLSFSGTVTADVRFYLNNGTLFNGYASPSNLFYHTGPFPIPTPLSVYPGTNSAVLTFSQADLYADAAQNLNPSMQMPSNFTVSVTIQGLSGSDSVGLNNFEPPAVGSNHGDYWYNNGGSWELLTFGNSEPYAFGMQFTATTQPVPEPATLCMTLAGAALLVGFARRRRQ